MQVNEELSQILNRNHYESTFCTIRNHILIALQAEKDVLRICKSRLTKQVEFEDLIKQDLHLGTIWKQFWDICQEPEALVKSTQKGLDFSKMGTCKVKIDTISKDLIKLSNPILSNWISSIPQIIQFYTDFLDTAQYLESHGKTFELHQYLSEKCIFTTDCHDDFFRMPNSLAQDLLVEKKEKDNIWLALILDLLQHYKDGDDLFEIFTHQESIDLIKVMNMQRTLIQLEKFHVDKDLLQKRSIVVEKLVELNIITRDFVRQTMEHVPVSNHDVFALPDGDPLIYVKRNTLNVQGYDYSLHPSKEYLVSALYHLLEIPCPQTALIMIDQVKIGKEFKGPFLFQVSQAIKGEVATKTLARNEKTCFDVESYSKQLIGCILTNPSDGKPDNYIVYENNKIISIDNDLVFEKKFYRDFLNVKSILLYLPERFQDIKPELKRFYSNMSPEMLVLNLKKCFDVKMEDYKKMMKNYIAWRHLDNIPLNKAFEKEWSDLRLESFKVEILAHLFEKLTLLRKSIGSMDTLNDLILTFYPTISHYNDGVLKKYFDSPIKALESVWFSLHTISNIVPRELNQKEKEINLEKELEKQLELVTIKDYLDRLISSNFHNQLLDSDLDFLWNHLVDCKLFGLIDFDDQIQLIKVWRRSFEKNPQLTMSLFGHFSKYNAGIDWMSRLEMDFPICANFSPENRFIIEGSVSGFRMLPNNCQDLLAELESDKRDNSLKGRSLVVPWPSKDKPRYYIKKYPEIPGYEYAATMLLRRFGVQDVPFSELYSFTSQSGVRYPVLIIEAILGDTLDKYWNNTLDPNEFEFKLDRINTGLQIIVSMLINPEDAKEDNWIFQGDKLIPIDNDHAFLPVSFQENGVWVVYNTLQTKTILFCLSMMKSTIPKEIKDFIINMDIPRVFQCFLNELNRLTQSYENLFDVKAQTVLYDYNKVVLKIPIDESLMEQMLSKMEMIQLFLRQQDDTFLRLLYVVEPYLERTYKVAFQLTTVKERFDLITNNLYKNPKNKQSVSTSVELMKLIHRGQYSTKEVVYKMINNAKAMDVVKKHIEQNQAISNLIQDKIETLVSSIDLSGKSSKEINANLKSIILSQPKTSICVYNATSLTSIPVDIQSHIGQNGNTIRVLDLRGASLGDADFLKIYQFCRNLSYLNVSGWKLNMLQNSYDQKTYIGIYTTILPLDSPPNKISLPFLEHFIGKGLFNLTRFSLKLPALKRIVLEAPSCFEFGLDAPLLEHTNVQIDFEALKFASFIGQDSKDVDAVKMIFVRRWKITDHLANRLLTVIKNTCEIVNKNHGPYAIAYALKFNTCVQRIYLSLDGIDDDGLETLCKSLANHPSLKYIDLAENPFKIGKGLDILLSGTKSLEEICISRSEIDTLGSFCNGLKNNSSLQRLYAWRCKIDDSSAEILAQALAINKSLTALEVGENKLGLKTGMLLGVSLEKNSSLHKLEIQGNPLGDDGIVGLAKGLVVNSCITTLNLSKCFMTVIGGCEVAKALLVNRTISKLSLSDNKIGDEGAIAILQTLSENTVLKDLSLDKCECTDVTAMVFAGILEVNGTLINFSIRNNQITDEGAQIIANSFKTNQTLQTLWINENKLISSTGRYTLKEYWNRTSYNLHVF